MQEQKAEAMLRTQKRRIAQKIFGHLNEKLGALKGQTIGLAISGGLDSRALLEAVARWPRRHEFEFLVVTVNHSIRAESLTECEAVKGRAQSLGFNAEVLSVFPGTKRDEASLRMARYNAIWRYLSTEGSSICCLAHQKDDDAEGVIMDLFGFGGGAAGAGMQALRLEKERKLVRPFLELERSYLHLFLSSLNVFDYFMDPSNKDGSNRRQQAREFLSTTATQFHPRPIERLAQIAQVRLEDQRMMSRLQSDSEFIAFRVSGLIEIGIHEKMEASDLRNQLKQGYKAICKDFDPRNAAPSIDVIVKKAKSLGLIRSPGVDPSGNSITLRTPIRLYFDLPGAKALMTPVMVSLYRNQNDLLVQ